MDGTTPFATMRRPVMVNAEQTPQYSAVGNAGHDGGDFPFVRKRLRPRRECPLRVNSSRWRPSENGPLFRVGRTFPF